MRTLIDVAKSIITNSEKSDADARGLMEFAEQKLYEIRQGKDATGLVKVDRAIFELYDKLQRISGCGSIRRSGWKSSVKNYTNINISVQFKGVHSRKNSVFVTRKT